MDVDQSPASAQAEEKAATEETREEWQRRHLELAESHVAQGEEILLQQRRKVAKLDLSDFDPEAVAFARKLLESMERMQQVRIDLRIRLRMEQL